MTAIRGVINIPLAQSFIGKNILDDLSFKPFIDKFETDKDVANSEVGHSYLNFKNYHISLGGSFVDMYEIILIKDCTLFYPYNVILPRCMLPFLKKNELVELFSQCLGVAIKKMEA